jgi:hypothetical protein
MQLRPLSYPSLRAICLSRHASIFLRGGDCAPESSESEGTYGGLEALGRRECVTGALCLRGTLSKWCETWSKRNSCVNFLVAIESKKTPSQFLARLATLSLGLACQHLEQWAAVLHHRCAIVSCSSYMPYESSYIVLPFSLCAYVVLLFLSLHPSCLSADLQGT